MHLPNALAISRFVRAVAARAAAPIRVANRDPFLLVALFCTWLASRAFLAQAAIPLGGYDEALLFLDAQMMHDGRAIYRDFYANYPPGIFQLIRGVGALGLPEIWTLRALTFLVHLASAVLSGRIVALVRGGFYAGRRRSICWTTTACVVLLQARLGCTPFAYCYAVLLVQVILLGWPKPGGPRWRSWLTGVLLGVLSYLRHDVCVYVFGALGAVELTGWVVRRRSSYFSSLKEALHLLGGVAGTVVVLWGPIFARAGIGPVLHDLVLDVSKLTMPARVLPIPPLTTNVEVGSLNISLPAFLSASTEVSLVLSAIMLCVGSLLAGRALFVRSSQTREQRLHLLLIACALATVPQALGRTDYYHVSYIVPLTLAAGASIWSLGWARFFLLLISAMPCFAACPALVDWASAKRFWHPSENSAFMTGEDKSVADYLAQHTRPGEPIFAGCANHERLIFNSLSPYYWGHRPGATRFMQLDPGLATATLGQSAMISDLERTRPKLALRLSNCWWPEPNASSQRGATLLDEYLASHYASKEALSSFMVWERKPD